MGNDTTFSWWRLETRDADTEAGYNEVSEPTPRERNGVCLEKVPYLAKFAKRISLSTGVPTHRLDVIECELDYNGRQVETYCGCVDGYCAEKGLII